MREYYKNGYDRKYIHSLLRFLDSVFQLPGTMDTMFVEEIIKMEEEHKVPDLSSVERVFMKRGKKEGKKEGKIEGIKEGRTEEKRAIALELIKIGIAVTDISKATGLSIEEIEKLSETAH